MPETEPTATQSKAHHNHLQTPMQRRAVALAGLLQAVYLVDAIARKGKADSEDCRTCLKSIFAKVDEQHPLTIYGGLAHLQTGLRIAATLLAGEPLPQAKALMTYGAGLMGIDKRLAKDPELLRKLAEGVERISKQAHYFGDVMHANVVAAIADLYGDTISTLKPRIIVRGKRTYLSQTPNTQRIRALLLAGLRAAHLWHCYGGGHLTLLLRRKALLREVRSLQQLAGTMER